jgi:hypothetical protein
LCAARVSVSNTVTVTASSLPSSECVCLCWEGTQDSVNFHSM